MSAWRRLAHRLLFVESPAVPPLPIAGTDRGFIVTVLLNLHRGITLAQLSRVLLKQIGPALSKPRPDWPIESISLFRGVRMSRPIVFFFELTRTRPVAAWLCSIAGESEPPPFHLSLCPQYEAIVELRFSEPVGAAALAQLRDLLHTCGIFNEPLLIGSEFQVRVYESGASGHVAKRVDICFLLRRPPGVTREACQTYWRESHAQLALHNMNYLRLTRYRQVHTLPTPPPGLDDTFDGVVYAEKPSFRQLFFDLLKPNTARFNSAIVVDECHFTDATPVTLMQRIGGWDADHA